MPTIRSATPGDASRLAQLAEFTFRATFGTANSAEDMELHCRNTYGEAIQAREIDNPHMLTLLCEEDGELIGFAQLRWGVAPACVIGRKPGEVQRLYVTSAWHGQGIAQALMNSCLQMLAQRGSDVVWLGVWEQNPRAMAFYRKMMFMEAGEHEFLLGNDLQRDIVMIRPVKTVDISQGSLKVSLVGYHLGTRE